MNNSPAKYLNKKGWLDWLYYKEGKQNFDFFLCGTYEKDGEIKFTKWKKYSECIFPIDLINDTDDWKDRNYYNQINQRQIFPNEIVLDIEDPKQLKPIMEKIKEWEWDCFVYETGSKGYHIHIFYDEDFKIDEKEAIVKKLGTDIQKCSEKNLIALEYQPHWRTGNKKKEIEV